MAIAQIGAEYPDKYEFQADYETDLDDLPTHDGVGIGSKCVCIETGYVYILNSEREWQLYGGVTNA